MTRQLMRLEVVRVDGLLLGWIEMAVLGATRSRLSGELLSQVAAGSVKVLATERYRGVRWPAEQGRRRMTKTGSVPAPKPPVVPCACSHACYPKRPTRDQAVCATAPQVRAGTVAERTCRLVLIQKMGLCELAPGHRTKSLVPLELLRS